MVGALVAQHKLTSERYAAGIPQFCTPLYYRRAVCRTLRSDRYDLTGAQNVDKKIIGKIVRKLTFCEKNSA